MPKGSAVLPALKEHVPVLMEIELSCCLSFAAPKRIYLRMGCWPLIHDYCCFGDTFGVSFVGKDVYLSLQEVSGNRTRSRLGRCSFSSSSLMDQPSRENAVIFGEIGLSEKSALSAKCKYALKEAKNWDLVQLLF